MKTTIEKRLQSLKAEYESGQKAMAELDAKQSSLQATLLRISGAIQVLEELINETTADLNSAEESVVLPGQTSIDAVP